MMYNEFMEIAGYKVSYEDYKEVIEPMYMAMPDSISKADFVSMIDRSRFEVKKTEEELRQEQEYKTRIESLETYIENNKADITYYSGRVESIKADIEALKADLSYYKDLVRNYKDCNGSYKEEIKMLKSLLA